VLLVVPSCSYQARKEQASYLVKAAARLKATRAVRGTLSVGVRQSLDVRSITVPNGGQLPPGMRQQLEAATKRDIINESADAAVDFSSGRSELLESVPPLGDVPVAVYAPPSFLVRRFSRVPLRRPWIEVDFSKITPRKDPPSRLPPQLGLDPSILVDLLAGGLSGSVHREGSDTVDGAPATRYSLHVDWDKAMSDEGRVAAGLPKLSKFRIRTLDRMYEQLAVSDTIIPTRLWLDAKGIPRRIEMRFAQTILTETQVRKQHVHFVTRVTLDVKQLGSSVNITLPSREERIKVAGVGDVIAQLRSDATRARGPTVVKRTTSSKPPAASPAPTASAAPGARR
jgi:hypothetical protein